MNMGEFPSGQRGQTVNLLLSASVVQIHPLPPTNRLAFASLFFYPLRKQWHIINNGKAIVVSHQSVRTVYHHTFRCVSKTSFAMMIYKTSSWWYAIPYGIDDIHGFAVIFYGTISLKTPSRWIRTTEAKIMSRLSDLISLSLPFLVFIIVKYCGTFSIWYNQFENLVRPFAVSSVK